MNEALNLIPEAFHPDCDRIARGYGISPQVAALLLLEAAGTALGPSMVFQTPEYRQIHGSFDLAIVSEEPPAVRSALFAFLAPVFNLMRAAAALRSAGSLKDAQADLEARITARNEYAAELRDIESRLQGMEEKQEEAKKHEFKMPASGVADINDPAVQAALAAALPMTGFYETKAELEARAGEMRSELGKWDASITDSRLLPAPYVIREDVPWNQLQSAGEESFDGAVLNVVGGQSLRHLLRGERRRLAEYAVHFHQSQIGISPTSPTSATASNTRLSTLVCGDAGTVGGVISDRDVMAERVFAGFLFTGDDTATPPDTDAIVEFFKTQACGARIEELFQQRLGMSQRVLRLDVDGFREYTAFRQWCRTFRAQWPALAFFFEKWPELALHLAQSSTALAGEHLEVTVPLARLKAATAFLRAHAPVQAALLARLTGLRSAADERDRQIRRLCQKLDGRGALTLREIARLYDRQNYEPIRAWIEAAIEAGRVERHGELFSVSAVSAVSASVVDNVTGIPEGVGA